MKRNVLLIATSLLLSVGAGAQLQVGLKAGYAMPAATAPIGTSLNGTQSTTIYGTFGGGIPISLEAAYFLNDNFGVQFDFTYLMGSSLLVNEILTPGLTSNTTAKTTQFRITPSLVFKTEMGIYSRFGAVLPVAGNTTAITEEANGGGLGIPLKREMVSKGKFGLGFAGALGYQFNIGDKLGVFGELEYIGLSIKRATAEMTMLQVGGVDQLPNLTDAQKNFNYADEINITGTDLQGTSSPYNSIGLNIGVRFRIGG